MEEENVQIAEKEDVYGSDLEDSTVYDGWDDDAVVADSPDDDVEITSDDVVEADQPEASEPETAKQSTEQTETKEPEQAQPADDADQYLELKHFDEVKKVSKDEAKTLAQKGMDYDRIRGKLSDAEANVARLQKYENFLNELKGNYATIDELMDDTRARVLADKEGISYEAAVAKVQTSARKAEAQERVNPESIRESMRKESLSTFLQVYPTVKAKEIPQEVWDDMAVTNSLVASYAKYEAKLVKQEAEKLKTENEILKQNKANEEKAVGSLKTSGSAKTVDKYLEGWDDD